jgi:hypothetical protein
VRARSGTAVALVLLAGVDVGAARAAIYGEDDRVEAVAAPEPIRTRALASTVAIVHADSIDACDPTALAWSAPTLGDYAMLCPEEPFVAQPVIAGCSAIAIAPELVLTAKHCVADLAACRDRRFVFGLAYDAAGELPAIPVDDVYGCRAVFPAAAGVDLAIVQLDRPRLVAGIAAPIAPRAALGDPLFVPGFPTGIPMKVAPACAVLDYFADGDTYYMNCDLMAGNSGSGVLDATGAVLGAYVLGAGDYRPRAPGECKVRFVLGQDGTSPTTPVPQLGGYEPAEHAVTALCAGGYASPLCGGAAACGDGACTDVETPATCAADCAAPRCGDGVCDLGEEHVCLDCGAAGLDACVTPPDDSGGGGGGGCTASARPEPSGMFLLLVVGAALRRRCRVAAITRTTPVS